METNADLRVIMAAINALATVNPDTIRRNRNGGRTAVDGRALAKLAEAIKEARPELMAEARHIRQCPHCGRQPWQTYHADDCPRRTHIVYDEHGTAHMPPGRD